MSRNLSASKRRPACAAAALIFALLACHGVRAQQPMPPAVEAVAAEPTLAELERNFWFCDFASTVALLDSGTAVACSISSEEFKQRRFNGDFHALHAYWKQNKEAEYRKLAAAQRARENEELARR